MAIQKLYTLGEAAAVLGVSEADIERALPKCASDFATRTKKKLTQQEVDCIAKVLGTTT